MNKIISIVVVAVCIFATVATARPSSDVSNPQETEQLIPNEVEVLRFKRTAQYHGGNQFGGGRRHGYRHNNFGHGGGPGYGHYNNGYNNGYRNPYQGGHYGGYNGYNQGPVGFNQGQSQAHSSANAQSFNGQIGFGPLQASFSGSQSQASASAGSANAGFGK